MMKVQKTGKVEWSNVKLATPAGCGPAAGNGLEKPPC